MHLDQTPDGGHSARSSEYTQIRRRCKLLAPSALCQGQRSRCRLSLNFHHSWEALCLFKGVWERILMTRVGFNRESTKSVPFPARDRLRSTRGSRVPRTPALTHRALSPLSFRNRPVLPKSAGKNHGRGARGAILKPGFFPTPVLRKQPASITLGGSSHLDSWRHGPQRFGKCPEA